MQEMEAPVAVNEADPCWVPSHYRVCKKMAMPREPKILTPPEENLYAPQSLKWIAALYVARNRLPSANLPSELKTLVQNITTNHAEHFLAYQRHCAQEAANGDISFGNFGMFPTALLEPQPTPGYLFRTNMIEQARAVLKLLLWSIGNDPIALQIQEPRLVRHILAHRYPHFLNMQLEALPALLVPPADVAQIWFFHMLQSDRYYEYLKSIFPKNFSKMYAISHSCLLSAEQTAKGTALCTELWNKKITRDVGPYVLKNDPSWADQQLNIPFIPNADDVIQDRQWIHQFLKATVRIGEGSPSQASSVLHSVSQFFKPTAKVGAIDDEAFLKRSLLGYQRFMFLMAKWNQRMEFIGFSPCPPIDLMWHTHLIQPAEYRRFSMLLLFNVHHHKLLAPKDRTRMKYRDVDEPDAIWRSEFGESQSIYLLPLNTPISSSLVTSFSCDACERSIASKTVRYHCQICQDFDLCSDCQKAKKTPGQHLSSHIAFAMKVH